MNDKKICSFPGMYEELVSFIEEFQLLRSVYGNGLFSSLKKIPIMMPVGDVNTGGK